MTSFITRCCSSRSSVCETGEGAICSFEPKPHKSLGTGQEEEDLFGTGQEEEDLFGTGQEEEDLLTAMPKSKSEATMSKETLTTSGATMEREETTAEHMRENSSTGLIMFVVGLLLALARVGKFTLFTIYRLYKQMFTWILIEVYTIIASIIIVCIEVNFGQIGRSRPAQFTPPVPWARPFLFMWLCWRPMYVVPEESAPGPKRSKRQRFRPPPHFDFSLDTRERRQARAIPNVQGPSGVHTGSQEQGGLDESGCVTEASNPPVESEDGPRQPQEVRRQPSRVTEDDEDSFSLPSPDRVQNLWRFGPEPGQIDVNPDPDQSDNDTPELELLSSDDGSGN